MTDKISSAVLKYIDQLKLDSYPGGIPNTLQHTGEQWDYPNVWPPMQYILVEGLDNLGTIEAKAISKKWGYRWVKSNFKAYSETRAMFEKVRLSRRRLQIILFIQIYFIYSTTQKNSVDMVVAVNTTFKKDLAGQMAS